MAPSPPAHVSVLPSEVLELLAPQPGETVVDATLGPGGHAEALLRSVGPAGRVVGIDRDPAALAAARERLAPFGGSFIALRGDHRDLRRLLADAEVDAVDRLLFDLGISSAQLDDPRRGFAFGQDGPLDMRLDPDSGRTAAELLAELDEFELTRLLRRYGEERRAAAIARAIVRRRETGPLERTAQLAELVARTLGPSARRYRIHPATRTFQALRIAVNGELVDLEATLVDAVELLRPGGRLAVIAFHSLEDRLVKRTFRALAHRCVCPPRLPVCGCGRRDLVRLLTPRAVRPGPEELARNTRARSARLRAVEKLG